MRIRALFGLYEGNPDEPVFAGAVEEVVWECVPDDEEWDRILAGLKTNAPEGTTDWQEAWIELEIPAGTFATPTLSAAVSVAPDSEEKT